MARSLMMDVIDAGVREDGDEQTKLVEDFHNSPSITFAKAQTLQLALLQD